MEKEAMQKRIEAIEILLRSYDEQQARAELLLEQLRLERQAAQLELDSLRSALEGHTDGSFSE